MSQEQKTKPQTYAEITAEDIQGWKAKTGHDELELVSIEVKAAVTETVNDPDTGQDVKKEITPARVAQFICIPPTKTVMDALGQHQQSKNIAAANKLLIANCVLGGDLDIMERDGGVYGQLLSAINKLTVRKEADIKKV